MIDWTTRRHVFAQRVSAAAIAAGVISACREVNAGDRAPNLAERQARYDRAYRSLGGDDRQNPSADQPPAARALLEIPNLPDASP